MNDKAGQPGQTGLEFRPRPLPDTHASVHVQGCQRCRAAECQAVDAGVCDAPDAVQAQKLQEDTSCSQLADTPAVNELFPRSSCLADERSGSMTVEWGVGGGGGGVPRGGQKTVKPSKIKATKS
jgi:hypothetical protein